MRKLRAVLYALALTLLLGVLSGLVLIQLAGYSASPEALETFEGADVDTGDWYAFDGGLSEAGVVLYPGALVEAEAYAPVAERLAEESEALVVVLRMPLELAILNGDGAEEVISAYPDVRYWIVGGHSLGGVAAAGFAEGEPGIGGLLLWASYPSGGTDLSGRDLEVASVWGTEDEVLNSESLRSADARLPASTTHVQIEGANHAQFGDYGNQRNDGRAEIPDEEAREEIASASAALIQRSSQRAE